MEHPTRTRRTGPGTPARVGRLLTALTDGISPHTDDGTTRRVVYRVGDTRHFSFAGDKSTPDDLYNNDGPTELAFLTVEHKSERKQDR